jgi:inhibitor of KinA
MPHTPSYHMYPCGDHAVTIELGNKVDAVINQKVMALFSYLKTQGINGVKDIIPAYYSLTIVYDIIQLQKTAKTNTVYEMICDELGKAVDIFTLSTPSATRLVRIPVCYDLHFAPDLASLAVLHKITIDDVIRLHTGRRYRVYMIGFLPGFAYMGTVDEKICTPRKSQPRTLVPAGSVGIAGEQTGIYPFDSPGGWQLIGQTPTPMFSLSSENPCYLKPGDDIEFYSIPVSEFEKQKRL